MTLPRYALHCRQSVLGGNDVVYKKAAARVGRQLTASIPVLFTVRTVRCCHWDCRYDWQAISITPNVRAVVEYKSHEWHRKSSDYESRTQTDEQFDAQTFEVDKWWSMSSVKDKHTFHSIVYATAPVCSSGALMMCVKGLNTLSWLLKKGCPVT